jgi:ubiquinone/menaquinone biosynthesis C-methylase UbiE
MIIYDVLKKILIMILPRSIIDLLKKILKKKNINDQNPKSQSLDIYYDEKMANALDTWGERSTWIEIQHLLFDKKGKTLDIACGTGKVIKILNDMGIKDIYGCDISDFLINKAKQKGIPEAKLSVCDATNLPYEENSFDYSYSIGSLEHFTEQQIEKFLISAKKVTKFYSFHQIPMSRSNKNEGWITPYQSYFNNSESWWYNHCKKVYANVTILDSTWEDDRSIGKWLILKK